MAHDCLHGKRKRHVPNFWRIHALEASASHMNGKWTNERKREEKKSKFEIGRCCIRLDKYWQNGNENEEATRKCVHISCIRSKSQFPIVKYAVFALVLALSDCESSKIVVHKWLPYGVKRTPYSSFISAAVCRYAMRFLSMRPHTIAICSVAIHLPQVSNNCIWIFDSMFFLFFRKFKTRW